MIKQRKLADLIGEYVHFRPISTGWVVGKCALCHDHKDRAGFKYDGNDIIYNCWNCSTTGRYEEFSGEISGRFRKILNAHGIDDTEISAVVNTAFFTKKEKNDAKITLAALTKINTSTPTVKLPPKSLPLGTAEFMDYQVKLVSYLEKRKVDLNKYKFFFSLEPRFVNRIIIPFYRSNQLIYWQARTIDDEDKKRYDNAPVGRDVVMFNFDKLNHWSNAPLFVTEGVFDAMMIDGIAILGSKLNDAKTQLLSASSRRLVFVIDKDSNGRHLAEDVLSKGWEIAFVPDGADDLNESVRRFGHSWTAHELMRSIPKDTDAAMLAINVNCGRS